MRNAMWKGLVVCSLGVVLLAAACKDKDTTVDWDDNEIIQVDNTPTKKKVVGAEGYIYENEYDDTASEYVKMRSIDVTFLDQVTEDGKRFGYVIASYDDETLWEYTTESFETEDEKAVQLVCQGGSYVLLNENGTLVCLNRDTGKVRWINEDFQGTDVFAQDMDHNIYISCIHGKQLYGVDELSGEAVISVDSFDEKYKTPLTLLDSSDGTLSLYFQDPSDTMLVINPTDGSFYELNN